MRIFITLFIALVLLLLAPRIIFGIEAVAHSIRQRFTRIDPRHLRSCRCYPEVHGYDCNVRPCPSYVALGETTDIPRVRDERGSMRVTVHHGCWLVATFAIIYVVAILVGPEAKSAEPYGGCDEAWQAPHSAGADWCRDHGWTVRPRLVVGPQGWVRYTALPQCRNEDGSGQRSACTWNLTAPRSWGLRYWIDYHNRTHYVRGLR